MRSCTETKNVDLHKLYDALSPETKSAIDDRALDWALIEDTRKNIDRLEKGLPIQVHTGPVFVGWKHVEQALSEALGQARCKPSGSHRPHQRPSTPAQSFPRAEAYAKFLYDNRAAMGAPSLSRPQGDFKEVMIRRGSLVDGEDFGILVNKQQVDTPMGKANEFYIFTKLAEMAGPTQTHYYGPFEDSILPNE
jgi:hypothetical protein